MSDDAEPLTGTVADGATTNDTTPTLTGTAEAGSVIAIFDNGTPLGTTTATGRSVELHARDGAGAGRA